MLVHVGCKGEQMNAMEGHMKEPNHQDFTYVHKTIQTRTFLIVDHRPIHRE